MKDGDFNLLAEVIGPLPGPAREGLRAYYVSHESKAASARHAGISRSAMTQFVARWDAHLSRLVAVNWTSVKKGLPGGPKLEQNQ